VPDLKSGALLFLTGIDIDNFDFLRVLISLNGGVYGK
jgi:hypothetical protein